MSKNLTAIKRLEQIPTTDIIYLGIDNGVSGSLGFVTDHSSDMLFMPVRSELSYTKAVRHITRIDWRELRNSLVLVLGEALSSRRVKVFLERPMVNPGRFQATSSALRALEATLIVLEALKLPLQYVDSKQWQKVMLPSGLKGPEQLKKASADIGCRLFPHLSGAIGKQKDADGILIAEWARREKL